MFLVPSFIYFAGTTPKYLLQLQTKNPMLKFLKVAEYSYILTEMNAEVGIFWYVH